MKKIKQNLKNDAQLIIEAGLKALDPKDIVRDIDFDKLLTTPEVKSSETSGVFSNRFNNIYLIGSGKGSSALAYEIINKVPQIKKGIVIDIKNFHKKSNLKSKIPALSLSNGLNLKFLHGTHPLPSDINIKATKKIENICKKARKNDLVIAIICGGTSALLSDPINPLKKTRQIYDRLLKSGASIRQINTVRRHIDRVKNGGLAKIAKPAKIIALYVSDVPGNIISAFGSGPFVADKSTNLDAKKILRKYGIDGDIRFTHEVKSLDASRAVVKHIIIAENDIALAAMRNKAQKLDYKTKIIAEDLTGKSKVVAEKLIKMCPKSTALIAAGETEVDVASGHGQGGRNTHLAANALSYLKPDMAFASIATDGMDHSDAAGAIIDIETCKKIKSKKIDHKKHLKNFDSYNLFKKTDDLYFTGHLPVNVADIYLVLRKD